MVASLLYGPRFFAGAFAPSTKAPMSLIAQSRFVTPAAIAGVTRSFAWSRTKF